MLDMDTPFTAVTAKQVEYLIKMLPHLCFEVTEACNLHCAYCAFSDLYTKNQNRKGRFLPFKTTLQLLDYLWNVWEQDDVKEIPDRLNISFYGGEPLLNYRLIRQIVAYAEKNAYRINRHITFSLTTNAVLLPKYIDFFVQKEFNLLISLDGDENGDSYRVDYKGHTSFQKVFSNLKKIAADYPEYFENHISFNAVLNNRNDYTSIYTFFKEQFNKEPTISPLSISNLNPNEIERFCAIRNSSPKEYESCSLSVSPVRHLFLKEFEMKSGNCFYDYDELLYDRENRKVFPTGTCLPFMKKMFLTVDGNILQCEKIDHGFVLGNVGDDGVHLDYEKIAQVHNEKVFEREHLCSSCKMNHYCSRCIYLETEPDCHRYTDRIPNDIDCRAVRSNLSDVMDWVYSVKTVK